MIIGITGTLGAGKGTVAQYLVERHHFVHYSVRALLVEEIERRGLPVNRDTMTSVSNDLRARYGADYLTQQLLGRALISGDDVVIESIRTVGEATYLKEHGAQLWAVDADIYTRYARITERASETDRVSFEKFQFDEQREFSNTDPTKQNIAGVIKLADTVFHNEGTTEELYAQIDQILSDSRAV